MAARVSAELTTAVLGWLLTRVRWTLVPWLTTSAAFGVYLTFLFTTWRWVA